MSRTARPAVFLLLPLVLGGCGWLADTLILHPRNEPLGTPSASRRTLTAAGAPIAGRSVALFVRDHGPKTSGQPELYILSLTGNAGRAERMTGHSRRLLRPWLAQAEADDRPGSIRIVALQYPGFGQDRGAASLDACAQAALEALDDLRRRAGARPIFVHGLSLGTAFALHLARSRPHAVEGLILEKPPNLRSMILGRYGWWNLWLLAGPLALTLPDAVRSEHNAARVDAPAVFLISPVDRATPASYAREITAVYRGPLRMVETRSAHNQRVTAANAPDLTAALAWLWSHRRRKPATGAKP